MNAEPAPDTLTRLTDALWVKRSRSMAYNCGAFISAGSAALIDPGLRPEGAALLLGLLAEQGAALERIIITHSHWDHILGPELLPATPITAHAAYRPTLERNRAGTLRMVARWDAHHKVERAAPFAPPMPDESAADGHELTLGELTLRLIHVPGHAADQVAIYEPRSAALWAADILSDLEIPFVSHSLAAYEATLARLAGLAIRTLVPGHGAPTGDAAAIAGRIADDRAYLAGLGERVRAVVAAGGPVEDALAACADMAFRNPEANAGPHRLNVESVYIELGGAADPDKVGWAQQGLIDE